MIVWYGFGWSPVKGLYSKWLHRQSYEEVTKRLLPTRMKPEVVASHGFTLTYLFRPYLAQLRRAQGLFVVLCNNVDHSSMEQE